MESNTSGEAYNVSALGFSSGSQPITIEANGNITVNFNQHILFVVPYNATIKSIYMEAGNTLISPCCAIYPYVELYTAPFGSNVFTPIIGSVTLPTTGIPAYSPANTTVSGFITGLNILVNAGDQILIGGKMNSCISPSPIIAHLYYSGGIEMAAR